MRKILGVYSARHEHWVGDGFPVRSLFSYASHDAHVSPFLLLDYAGPAEFTLTNTPRGVGTHPHRGRRPVDDRRRSHSHKEFQSEAFTRKGGPLEMVQLWVNLPANDKDTAPGYQTLLDRDIPSAALPNGADTLRVITGTYDGKRGPARTFAPIDVWDVRAQSGRHCLVHLARRPHGRSM